MRALPLAAVVLSAGCLSFLRGEGDEGSDDDPSPEQDHALFLYVSRSFGFERTEGEGPAYGPSLTIGSHCGNAAWTTDPPSVTVHDWTSAGTDGKRPYDREAEAWEPSGIVVTSIDHANITNSSYSSFGTGPTVIGFDAGNDTFGLPTAFGPSRTLVTITTRGGAVNVAGTLLEPGVPHVERVAYVIETPGEEPARYAIYEALTFTLHGVAPVKRQVMGHGCI